jgi:site-specific DNA recombinase
VPAAEVEAAAVNQICGVLRAPEVLMSTWRAAQLEIDAPQENDVRQVLITHDPLWVELIPAEQAYILQLLMERVDIDTEGLKLWFRDKGMAQMAAEVSFIAAKTGVPRHE